MNLSATTIMLYATRAILLGLFAVLGWRDLSLLFRRPAKNMGSGISRVWTVARTTLLEAWAGRIWLLPVLWLIAAFIMVGSVRVIDLTDTIPEYIRMLLTSQELLLLVMFWVMACVSLPRERERKIVITNASKPISRLEIVLGKMAGFSLMSGIMLLVMGAISVAILYAANARIKNEAAINLALNKSDTAQLSRGSLEWLADQGSLFAYNYITIPKGNMSIVGDLRFTQSGPVRFIKGGGGEKASYIFSPRLVAPPGVLTAPVGTRPVFHFFFPIPPDVGQSLTQAPQIDVTAYCSSPDRAAPPRPQEKTLTLDESGQATWEPDNPEELYSLVDPKTGQLLPDDDLGQVTVDVRCSTPGVLLQVLEGASPDPVTGQFPPDAQFNVWCDVDPRQPDYRLVPEPQPVVVGYQRHDRQEITGPQPADPRPEFAVYRFPGGSLRNVPVDKDGNFTLTLLLETYKADNVTVPTTMNVEVLSSDHLAEAPYVIQNMEVDEKRPMSVTVPASSLGNPDPTKRGDMWVILSTPVLSHSLSIVEDSVRIELPASPFALNLFKSEAVIFLESVLLIVISVTCSVRLGWAVAMFLSAIVFVFGYFVTFIIGIQQYGGLMALNYRTFGEHSAIFHFFDVTTDWLWRFLGVVAQMTPDFSSYQAQAFIPDLRNMPWSVLGTNALDTLIFALPVIAIAFFLARKQELG